MAGVCAIKPEFLLDRRNLNPSSIDGNNTETSTDEPKNESDQSAKIIEDPLCKKAKLTPEKRASAVNVKNKQRGQNKARPKPTKGCKDIRPCPTIKNVPIGKDPDSCRYSECKFIHDPAEYIRNKENDIESDGGKCHIFDIRGFCQYGITCRFASGHMTADYKNILSEEKYSKWTENTFNAIKFDLQSSLQKRKYSFELADNVIKEYDKKNNIIKNNLHFTSSLQNITDKSSTQDATDNNSTQNTADYNSTQFTTGKNDTPNCADQSCTQDATDQSCTQDATDQMQAIDLQNSSLINKSLAIEMFETNVLTKLHGAVTDEDLIRLRDCEKTKIDWTDKLYLSPLTTVGNLPFRRICKEFGADVTCGEMALCESLLKGFRQEWALVKRHSSEDLFGVQICGNNVYIISKTAQIINEQLNVDFVDLNLGCPIELICRKGAGCGMLLRSGALQSSISCASQVLRIPFTVKTRIGVYHDKKVAHTLAPKFAEWGASLITVHGRSMEQRYTKYASWEYIEECAQAASPCPVFGNGDIFSYEDYLNARNTAPSVKGVMIGRGALIKPWIFTEIKSQKPWDISSSERFDILKKYTNYGLEHWGSDTKGVENTRRFMLEWLSFLYRYVPMGLLEQPPQKINMRPPAYFGRNDLETLMASSNCADWIKISEMLLGPVPDGFNFLPKHKANSY